MTTASIEVKNLAGLVRALRDNAGAAQELTKAYHDIGLHAVSESRRQAPVNSGKLRNSIFYEVDWAPLPTYVKVGVLGGPAVSYAAYMEYGTGTRHDHPSWPHKPHRVPASALEAWVSQKGRSRGERAAARRDRLARVGADARRVAYFIMKRGGLEPRRYLRDPFESNQTRYINRIRKALGRMALNG